MIRQGVGKGVQGLLLVVLVALVAGQLLGQPILLGFVETGSMEPTIETGDGFVAIPSELTGPPESGDVVVFEAEEIEGGGLTTHRIVDETGQGYVTRGDANPFTDQDGDEPPVQDGQIVATALQVNNEVVTIPSLGTAVMTVGETLEGVQRWLAATLGFRVFLGTSGVAYLLLAVSLLLYGLETVRERRQPSRRSSIEDDRDDGIDPRVLAGTFALVVVVAASAAMLAPAGTHSYDVVSAEFDSDQSLIIEQGTTAETPHPIPNGGVVPVVAYVESESETVDGGVGPVTVGPRETEDVTLTVTAPEETGYYPAYVTEYRFLYLLPLPVLDALYDLHPWTPFVAIVSLLGGGFYWLGRRLLGPADPRTRTKRVRNRRKKTRSNLRRRN
ncbi:S26 family signal peptidase [Natronobacterium texcoconense]|uniref:Signal peptidase, endoplasmic reticulum-type n=1 Tax=Natronobacterium texcoconense TaxID=1095778 RepID=A0A1H1IN92_NATTX|nr:S26 family signal peptidase [Natronobacterium texcoconense]SDR38778.1 signal peptidase, endoplasmic reticulum-type [Natronobacterium texcoconense]